MTKDPNDLENWMLQTGGTIARELYRKHTQTAKIIKCSSPSFWYTHLVGEEIRVYEGAIRYTPMREASKNPDFYVYVKADDPDLYLLVDDIILVSDRIKVSIKEVSEINT